MPIFVRILKSKPTNSLQKHQLLIGKPSEGLD